MNFEVVTRIADVLQLAAGVIYLIGYLPQMLRLYRTKSSRDMSLAAWLMWNLASSFGLFYAVVQLLKTGSGWPLIFTTGLCFVLSVVTSAMIYCYAKPRVSNVHNFPTQRHPAEGCIKAEAA